MEKFKQSVTIRQGEYWWGGSVSMGYQMPFGQEDTRVVDPTQGMENDQFAPLFLSSQGRYLWSERPFALKAEKGAITCEGYGEIRLMEGYENLRGAYLAAMKAHFPFTGRMPQEAFFTVPQYNTWIELQTNQRADLILRYAQGILSHGLPAGILMIDEGWQEDYGVFEFNKGKIPQPESLVAQLHEMGFQVMLWVTPVIASAGPNYQQLEQKGLLLRNAAGEIAVRKWWNGYSALLDLTRPEAAEWLIQHLTDLQRRYGVDGFKFDAGDQYFYRDDDQFDHPMLAREVTACFNQIGERFPCNEFRSAWKFGGRPIVARLHDKNHSWKGFGLDTLIPHTVMQGLLGYAFCCPDMVGGGQITCFTGGRPLDQELFVRWAQANACMGMMQMSISPWRVLSPENTALVIEAFQLHAELGERVKQLAKESAQTGEPIVRSMAYVFGESGLEKENTQFMLGNDLLVAPVLEAGARQRKIRLPQGRWMSWNGQVYEGPAVVELPVKMNDIPRFERMG